VLQNDWLHVAYLHIRIPRSIFLNEINILNLVFSTLFFCIHILQLCDAKISCTNAESNLEHLMNLTGWYTGTSPYGIQTNAANKCKTLHTSMTQQYFFLAVLCMLLTLALYQSLTIQWTCYTFSVFIVAYDTAL
jgi:hypothetical protein